MRIALMTLCLMVMGTATGMAKEPGKVYGFRDLDPSAVIRIDMPQFRVRVDGWDRDYVEVTLNLKAKSPVRITERSNRISLGIDEYRAPLWEPAVRIRAPRNQPIAIRAGKDCWLKDCTVDTVSAGRAYVRDCDLLRNMRVKARWGGGWRSREGWKAVEPNR